jgi:hypothetical protein
VAVPGAPGNAEAHAGDPRAARPVQHAPAKDEKGKKKPGEEKRQRE